MDITEAYVYCPRCRTPLKKNGARVISCSACSLVLYLNPAPCNAVIITDTSGQILLVKRKFDPKKGMWDVPGGFIEFDETGEESARREIQEELGIRLNTLHYLYSATDIYDFKGIQVHTFGMIFVAQIEHVPLQAKDDIESAQWFAPEKIPFESVAFPSIQTALKQFIDQRGYSGLFSANQVKSSKNPK